MLRGKGVLTHCPEDGCGAILISTKGADFPGADRGGLCPKGHGHKAGKGH